MGSLVRRVRRRKQCFGVVRVLQREEYQGMESVCLHIQHSLGELEASA